MAKIRTPRLRENEEDVTPMRYFLNQKQKMKFSIISKQENKAMHELASETIIKKFELDKE